MAPLVWDQITDRRFEAGVDRGVLYLSDDSGVAWNGLTSVQEDEGVSNTESFYFDGIKYNEIRPASEFTATLNAYTYPDEFLEFDGIVEAEDGFFLTSQPVRERFGLSYRTLIGNPVDNLDLGYKIHILYNLTAIPQPKDYKTLNNSADPSDFSWKISGVPVLLDGYGPTVHVIFDTTKITNPEILVELEEILYGTSGEDPRLPTISELNDFIADWMPFSIVDNGDGTWTATGSSHRVRTPVSGEFAIVSDQSNPIDSDTYELTTT